MKGKLESLQNEIKDFVTKADTEEKQLQNKIDSCRDALVYNNLHIIILMQTNIYSHFPD